jgi:hypothetical protein
MLLIMVITIIAVLFVVYSMFYRYFPVKGIHCIPPEKIIIDNNLTLLDVRDYNVSSSDTVTNALNIPYAYLKRYYREVSGKSIVLIVSDPLLLNVSVRYLRRKNIQVVGYYLSAEQNINSKTCFDA